MRFDFLQYLYKAFTYNFIATSTEKWAEKILLIGNELQFNEYHNEKELAFTKAYFPYIYVYLCLY